MIILSCGRAVCTSQPARPAPPSHSDSFYCQNHLSRMLPGGFLSLFFSSFFPAAPRLAFLTIDLISQIFLQLVTLIRDTRCCFKLRETEARMEISRLSHRSPSVMYDIHSHNVSVWKRTVGLSHVRGNLAACRLHSAGSLTAVAWFGAHASYSTVNGGRSELFCSLAGCRRLCVRHFYICRGDICR